ncbi:hypothetical protein BVF91_07420 [Thermoanaerobacterium sp. PSU-2]|nr:hypothetical protein BVF91_07420 [Thermoanaerobacterium sp. PSU-2]
MQIIFHVDNIEEYLQKGKNYNFPISPDRCPHSDCKCKVKLKKHGLVLCQEKVQIKMSKLFPSISVRIKL